MSLPKQINAIRAVTYSVDDDLINSIAEVHEIETDEVTLDLILDWIADEALEELSTSYTPIIFRDENDEELGTL